MTPYIAAIWSFGFNFAPQGWALCNGQLMAISQNEALFALIGTTFGGDGQTTFGIPDLQGRTPIGTGQGPGLPNYVIGQSAGSETVTLTTANLPAHNHPVVAISEQVNNGAGGGNNPNASYFGIPAPSTNVYSTSSNGLMASNSGNTGASGSSIPISILSPFLVVNFCIAVEGIFPSRN